jgi:hypothetical protein
MQEDQYISPKESFNSSLKFSDILHKAWIVDSLIYSVSQNQEEENKRNMDKKIIAKVTDMTSHSDFSLTGKQGIIHTF